MVHASLFSGLGAADLAAHWIGWENAFWCETNDFCRQILQYWFPKSKGYGNIKETDFTSWWGKIDVLTGGFPCQPFSVAGQRKGSADDRYLWPEMLRAIREIRPDWVVGENVAGIISMVQPGCEVTVESQTSLFEAFDKEMLLEQEYVVATICRDIEQEGYSVQPVVIPACAVGAPHRRDRVFFIAYRTNAGVEGMQQTGEDQVYQSGIITDTQCQRSGQIREEVQTKQSGGDRINGIGGKRHAPYTYGEQSENTLRTRRGVAQSSNPYIENFWEGFPTQSPVCSGDDGLSSRLDGITFPRWRTESIKGYGNAIVPQVMYEIFKAIETIQH